MNSTDFFGQSTTDTEWQRIKDKYPYNTNSPKPPTDQINLNSKTVDPKLVEETKKTIENFQEKMANWPKHISYEGSVVLCVLLSMNEVAHTHVGNLPVADYQVLRSVFPEEVALNDFSAMFDGNKDFIITVPRKDKDCISFLFFNSVAHPRYEDLKVEGNGEVPVEKDGDKISVGAKLVLDKKGIKRLIGVEPLKRNVNNPNIEQEDLLPKRQPVSGRNAYEIRADVLALSVEWASRKDIASEYTDPDDIIDLAKKFYSFVENKR